MTPVNTIPNDRLRPDDVPGPDADWGTIWEFAHTFDGYTHWGSFERCAVIANQRRDSTLTELRTCLFFEARAWRHGGYGDPDGEHEHYICGLLAKILAMIGNRRVE
jgi:hypothetical protein